MLLLTHQPQSKYLYPMLTQVTIYVVDGLQKTSNVEGNELMTVIFSFIIKLVEMLKRTQQLQDL